MLRGSGFRRALSGCPCADGRPEFINMSDPTARYTQMVAKHPENELLRFSLAKALIEAGDHAGACPQLEAALARRPDWMAAQILLGRSRLKLGDRAGARSAFERAHQLATEQHHEGPQAEMEEQLSELN